MRTRTSNYMSKAFATAAIFLSTTAFAHPKLLSSTPSDQAEVSAPAKIELHFSEDLLTQFSAAKLVMPSMPGMNMPMKMSITVSGGEDAKTMIITPTMPLHPGNYRVDWRAVSSDTHPVTGSFSFTVK